MTAKQATPTIPVQVKQRFIARHKLLSDPEKARQLAEQIKGMLAGGPVQAGALRNILDDLYPPDLADVLAFLDDAQDLAVFSMLDDGEAAELLDEVDECTRGSLVQNTEPARLARIVEQLPSDEATDIVQVLKPEQVQPLLALVDPAQAQAIKQLMAYPPESAGGLMSLGYVAVDVTATMAQAEKVFRDRVDAEPLVDLYVVDRVGVLQGCANIKQVLRADPQSPVQTAMAPVVTLVPPDMDQEKVSRIFARYDLTALPVVAPTDGKLLGIITADDMIDVIEAEATEDTLRMAGSDAEEMERRSPARTALLRLPWIMATMFIELGAGVVIHFYDATLAKVLLLASFMPIISAISGNTGLQSATIIVRGISTGQVHVTEWRRALLRQLTMTLLLGAATGLVLGIIGAFWYGKWSFGLVVFIGMFAAVNIAGIVGTVVPLISKSLGFDPAITSGPFETAFQDVVGISIFLTLATIMMPFLN